MGKTLLTAALAALLLAGCDPSSGGGSSEDGGDASAASAAATVLTVYKSPTCGCCEDWVTHMEGAGFDAMVEHPEQLRAVKAQLGIEPTYASCHTGVSAEGFVFEGHVPAKLVRRFLESPPEGALGLAVPRMPVGSPGMEMGDRFEPYEVLLLMEDGSSEVFARVESAEQQY